MLEWQVEIDYGISRFLFMAISREKKERIVKELKTHLASAPSIVFVNFHGLTVLESKTIRRALLAQKCKYKVAKKSLMRIALKDLNISGTLPSLGGEIALSWGEDPLLPAKELYQFARNADSKLQIVGGVFENRYLSKEEVISLATIPSREELYGKLLFVCNGPIRGFAVVLNETLRSFVRVLNAVRESKA